MKKFIEQQNSTTVPMLTYIVSSFFVLFVSELVISLILMVLFFVTTYLLTSNYSLLIRVILISLIVNIIYLIITSMTDWHFTTLKLQEMIPLGIGFSIVVCTGIVVFKDLPTFQLVKSAKFISSSESVIYAIMAGFRTFPIVFNISSKTIVAIKARGLHKSKLLTIKSYLMNILINFFEFIFDFQTQLENLDMKKINLDIKYLSAKNILFFVYLTLCFGGALYAI